MYLLGNLLIVTVLQNIVHKSSNINKPFERWEGHTYYRNRVYIYKIKSKLLNILICKMTCAILLNVNVTQESTYKVTVSCDSKNIYSDFSLFLF